MLTILVVDDDADLRTALAAVLEDAGYRVVQAENGAEALVELAKAPADLAVVDVMMPVMDGLSLHDQIRGGQLCPQLPILLVTASRLSQSAIGGRRVPIVHKPVTPTALLDAISKLLPR
jgi:two-component system OmpR family response regulator